MLKTSGCHPNIQFFFRNVNGSFPAPVQSGQIGSTVKYCARSSGGTTPPWAAQWQHMSAFPKGLGLQYAASTSVEHFRLGLMTTSSRLGELRGKRGAPQLQSYSSSTLWSAHDTREESPWVAILIEHKISKKLMEKNHKTIF